METSADVTPVLQRVLLSCGILASLLYLGTDRLAGTLFQGYSFSAQSMSDLGASGSPTRPLVVVLTVLASTFMVAFGAGIWRATSPAILPRVVAGLVLGNAILGLVASLFFPNRLGVRPEFGTPGVLLMFLSVLCFILAMVLGAAAFQGWMRILSIAIPAAYILLAGVRLTTAASAPGETAVLIGMQERTMGYSFLAWVMALAIYLLLVSSRTVDVAHRIGG